MTNMKSRNGSESDAIYVCHILFSCTSFMYGSCILHFIYVDVHRCLQVSDDSSDDGDFFLNG